MTGKDIKNLSCSSWLPLTNEIGWLVDSANQSKKKKKRKENETKIKGSWHLLLERREPVPNNGNTCVCEAVLDFIGSQPRV